MAKKVCHVTSVHGRYDPRIFFKECTSLAKAGYDVTLLVADGKPEEVRNGVRIVSVDFHPKNRVDRILHSASVMKKAAMLVNADIYHFHDPELLPVALYVKKHAKKAIFDSHEDVSGQIRRKAWIPCLLRPLISFMYSICSDYVLKQLDAVIAVSPSFVEKLQKINPNTVMITNYPILTECEDNKATQHSDNTFVFAGGISEQWNHDTILDALKTVDAKYRLMGPVEDEYLIMLKQHPSWAKVEYLGKVPVESVKHKLEECTAGLAILDYSENSAGKLGTLGNTKLFETMQAGIPVICTEFTLWKEIVDKWHCGICIPPRDVKALATAMQYIISNPEEARQMGENGRRAVAEEFNWGVEEKKLLDLYTRL